MPATGQRHPHPPAGHPVLGSQMPPGAGQLWAPLTWLFQGAISQSSGYSLSRQRGLGATLLPVTRVWSGHLCAGAA